MSQHFHPLTIAEVRPNTDEAVTVSFAVPEDLRELFQYRPGQHLTLRAELGGVEVRRTYSVCSGPGDAMLSVTVKRVAGGMFSNHANDTFRPGTTLDVMPPAGRFVLPLPAETEAARTYLAIAAGSGITPVISMLRHALESEPASRFVLIYGNRAPGTILFREALDDIKDRFLDRFVLLHVLSRSDESESPLLSGRITGEKLEALVPTLIDPATLDHAFLCGPDTMIKSAMDALKGLGVPREKIHFEFFIRGSNATAPRAVAPPPPPTSATAWNGPQITAILDGARLSFRAEPGEKLVDAAIRAGLSVPYSCKGGMCCTCRARVIEGRAEMAENWSLEPWEIEKGFVLTCQAVPKSERIVVDYDQM